MSKPLWKRRYRYGFGGKKGWLKGKKNEEKFYCSFCVENFEKPAWFKTIRHGTPNEDNDGIDFVVETYTNPSFIFVQIKSSEVGKRKFLQKHKLSEFIFPMIVLILNRHDRYSNIRGMLFEAVRKYIDD